MPNYEMKMEGHSAWSIGYHLLPKSVV